MNIKRLLPMEVNFVIRNIRSFMFQKQYFINVARDKSLCFYLDAATYNNIGDQAISYSMSLFLEELFGTDNFVMINEQDITKHLNALRHLINSNDVIALSGGGNIGDLYPRYESIRRLIVNSFPDNRIVVFPQTVDFKSDAYGKREFLKSINIYNEHKKILICAREQKSYCLLRDKLKRTCLVPDIVFNLYGKMDIKVDRDRTIGICLRDDSESTLEKNFRKSINHYIKEAEFEVTEISTMAENIGIIRDNEARKEIIFQKINEFAKCSCIITDRLHGMIFSIIAQVPCLIIDNSNHKVFGVYHSVMDCLQGVDKLNDYETVEEAIKKVVQKNVLLDKSKLDYSVIAKYLKEY